MTWINRSTTLQSKISHLRPGETQRPELGVFRFAPLYLGVPAKQKGVHRYQAARVLLQATRVLLCRYQATRVLLPGRYYTQRAILSLAVSRLLGMCCLGSHFGVA